MPGGDGTGPNGTFRNCVPQGTGYGRGRGFGRGRFFAANAGTNTQSNNIQSADRISQLESKMNELSSELREIKNLLLRK